MSEYFLEPIYDSRMSFYSKAKVVEEDGVKKLYSYKSLICEIQDDNAVIIHNIIDHNGESLTFSNTSLRHLKEFLRQNNLAASSKAQIFSSYAIVEEAV